MKPINVLHVIEELGVGGAERVVANYLKHHDTSLFRPQVCTLKGGGLVADEIIAMDYKVSMLNKKKGLNFSVINDLKSLIKKENIQVLHLHNPPANNWGVAASFFNGNVFTIRTEHNIFYNNRVMRGYPIINAILGLFNKKIICVSEQVKRTHLNKDWLNRSKYVTIYNGIDGEIYNEKFDLSSLREEFGIKKEQPVIGKIASLSIQKAHHVFFESARLVLKKIPDAVFLVVGDGKLRQELKSHCNQIGIGGNVIFTGIRQDIPAILNLIDIFTLSSDWEGFPMTILEAMAAGKPCVVTDVGGNNEAIVEGQTGYLIPPQKPQTLSDKLIKLVQDKNLSDRMGSAGKRHFESNFTAETMVYKTECIYKQCLGI